MTTYREERRQDRAAQAQIERDNEAARAKIRTAEKRAALDRAEARRKARSARRSARAAALRARTVDLVLAPVIVTGAVLAWFGMGGYGVHAYGQVGIILPVLSEGGMWAFAAATTLTLHRDPHAPVWHLRAGTAVFALVGAVLNFLHGLPLGIPLAVTMAVVSVSGVLAHQLITAGPRRSHIDRRIARKIREAQKAVVDAAPVELDADGAGRITLAATVTPLAGDAESAPREPETSATKPRQPERQTVAKAVTVAVSSHPRGTLMLSFIPPVRMPTGDPTPKATEQQFKAPAKPTAETPGKPTATAAKQPRPARQIGAPRRRGARPDKVSQLLAKGGLTNAEIAKQANVSERTVERRRSALREAPAVVNLDDRRRA